MGSRLHHVHAIPQMRVNVLHLLILPSNIQSRSLRSSKISASTSCSRSSGEGEGEDEDAGEHEVEGKDSVY